MEQRSWCGGNRVFRVLAVAVLIGAILVVGGVAPSRFADDTQGFRHRPGREKQCCRHRRLREEARFPGGSERRTRVGDGHVGGREEGRVQRLLPPAGLAPASRAPPACASIRWFRCTLANKKRWRQMRRTVLPLSSMAATLAVFMAVSLVAASGVALALDKLGTSGPDTLRGTNKSDHLLGRGGGDDIYGLGGTDNLQGGPGKDFVFGGRREHFRFSGGNKNLMGGPGNDYANGGLGSDNVAGQEGNDLLWGGNRRDTSIDVLSGGDGGDVFFVFNELAPKKDVVVCGDGRDRVLADRADVLAPDCERTIVVHGSQEEIRLQEAKFNDSIQRFYKGIRFPGDP